MKHWYLLIFFFSFTIIHAQELQLAEVTDLSPFLPLGSVGIMEKHELSNTFVTIVAVADGTSDSSETNEVAENLFITNCESEEGEDCKLYVLKNLIALTVDKVWQENGEAKVTISYGNAATRKSETVILP